MPLLDCFDQPLLVFAGGIQARDKNLSAERGVNKFFPLPPNGVGGS